MPARSALAARNAATPASDTPASGKRARRRSLVTPGSTTSSLPPNDDAREKAAARRRRSATGDGRALEADLGGDAAVAPPAAPQPPRAPALDAAAIAALYQNCLKLASENKITAKNTWALPLIDHMADLVASDAAARGGATDFARASLTLAAGVSIYAHRVDAVHGDVFRILGGLGRAEAGDDGDDGGDEENAGDDGAENADNDAAAAPRARRRRARAADADPASTLEPDAAINAKKFDLAFAVDPLFQRTAAKFDGGAADGLLLNTLPLLGGPCLAFDSALVPDDVPSVCGRGGGGGKPLADGPVTAAAATALEALNSIAPSAPLAELAAAAGAPEAEDAGEAAALVQEALAEVDAEGVDVEAEDDEEEDEGAGQTADAGATTITVKQEPGVAPAVDDEWTTAAVAAAVATQSGLGGETAAVNDGDDDDDDDAGLSFGAFGGGDLSDDDGAGVTRSRTPLADAPSWIAGGGGADPTTPTRATSSAAADDALRWLVGAGVDGDAAPPPTGGKAAWAGATHWRHRAARLRPLVGASDDGGGKQPPPPPSAVRPARRRPDPLDFTALPPLPPSALKRAPARETTLRAARARADTLLPDDVHYSPSALGALFLAPELGAAAAAAAALAAAASPTRRPAASDDDDDSEGGGLPGGVNPSDDDEEEEAQEGALAAALAAAPAALAWGADPAGPAPAARLAPEAPVAYTRAAKRVDVRALKEALWAEARDAASACGGGAPLRLADLVPAVAAGRGAAAAPPGQLSPHLVFICLLHLCNEHGLELGREGAGPAAAGAAAVRLGGGADVTVVGVPPV